MNSVIIIVLSVILIIILFYLVFKDNALIEEQNKKIDEVDLKLDNMEDYFNEVEYMRRSVERDKHDFVIQTETTYKEEFVPSQKLNVLVGDYMKETSLHANKILKSLGFETYFVKSSSDIIDLIDHDEKFDLIISNAIYKNSIDGTVMVSSLKGVYKIDIPVFVLTVSTNDEEYFLSEGFDGFLPKPLNQAVLKKELKKVYPELSFKRTKSTK